MRLAPLLYFTIALASLGCGDAAGTGAAGTGGGAGGTAGAPTAAGLDLTYEGEPMMFDTMNTCLINADAIGANFSSVTVDSSMDNIALTLQSETLNASALLARESLTSVDLLLQGTIGLSEFDAGNYQLIGMMDAMCTADVTFVESVQTAELEGDRYDVSFDCATVPFDLVNVSMMFVDTGTLTDLSGSFDCIVTPLMVSP